MTQSGQIIIVVLLTSIVLLTVGLAIASQTITDLNISTQEQGYTRSFNAAEAGIEEMLGRDQGLAAIAESAAGCTDPDSPCDASTIGNADSSLDYKFTFSEVGTSGFETDSVANGDTYQINLSGYTGNALSIYWNSYAVIELSFFYNDTGTIRILKRLIKPSGVLPYQSCVTGDSVESNLAVVNPILDDPVNEDYVYGYEETAAFSDFTAKPELLRVKPLCADGTNLAFIPPDVSSLPPQTYTVQVESNTGGNVAALKTNQSAQKSLPGIFDYTLFSGSNIQM